MSAVAIVATASLSFSSADGAGAFAQDAAADALDSEIQADAAPEAVIEIMPEAVEEDAPVFVSEPVVQDLPEPVETPSPAAVNANSLRDLVAQVDKTSQWSDQMQCLAGAVYFEARGEPLAGQLAVAEVVINRADDRRFPASYCGVVYQRAQFSFVKNGRMPRIKTNSAAWNRAKAIARIAHENMWDAEIGQAVYFHAKYVRPSWSRRKTRTAQIDTHIFYR
ncbi:MAG: cell wall hydrolase [Pseudomonadota bacterium]